MSDEARALQIQGEAAKVLLANICDVIGDDDELALTAVEGETGLIEAINAAVDRIAALKDHSQAIDYRIEALKLRQSRFDRQAELIKSALQVAMSQAELRKLELPQATLSIRAVPPKVELVNEAAIPPAFWKPQDPKLDKAAILKALKDNETVPGAMLSNGGETLAIREK